MDIQEIVSQQMNQETRKLIRTSAMFGEDQIAAIEVMAGGNPRGPRNRKFARMMRVVIDAGLQTIQTHKKAAKR